MGHAIVKPPVSGARVIDPSGAASPVAGHGARLFRRGNTRRDAAEPAVAPP